MCLHTRTVVREKKDSAARSLYARQCLDCNERVGEWISHRDPVTWNAAPWVNSPPASRDGQLSLFEAA